MLPSLSHSQLTKIRQLTLVELASRSRSLPFSTLLASLELSSIRDLENLIIECLYSDLLKARINQRRQILEVDNVVGRDVRVSFIASRSKSKAGTDLSLESERSLATMMNALGTWFENVQDTLAQLDHHILCIRKSESVFVQFVSFPV